MAMRFLRPPAGGDSHTVLLPGGQHVTYHDADGDGVIDTHSHHDGGRSDWSPYDNIGPRDWIPASTHGCGPTSARPGGVTVGASFIDTTLQLVILFNGAAWVDPVTGRYV